MGAKTGGQLVLTVVFLQQTGYRSVPRLHVAAAQSWREAKLLG
jgi:hypothetical protein